MKKEKVEFDGINGKIKGIVFYPEKENPPGVLMVHGYGGEGLQDYFVETAKEICDRGFAVMTFLFSGYNSLPDMTDVSIKDEIKELKLAINFFEKQKIDKSKISIFAQSLGCSISILLNDQRIKSYFFSALNPRLKKIFKKVLFTEDMIKEMENKGFCERKSISTDQIRRIGVRFWDELKEIDEIKKDKIREIDKPVFMCWGTEDEYTTQEEAKEFYDIFNDPKKMLLIEKGLHTYSHCEKHKEIIVSEATDWFKRWLE